MLSRNVRCERCLLHQGCQHVCLWGEGKPHAKLCLVGEAPGREEDMLGRPFMGRAGKLLDYLLNRLGIPRGSVWITNAIKCRHADNSLPTKKAERAEILQACRPYLDHELAAMDPRGVVVTMGVTALQALTGHADISNWWGRVTCDARPRGACIVAAFHPAFVLRKPSVEWQLASALALGAKLAGIETKQTYLKTWFDYENF